MGLFGGGSSKGAEYDTQKAQYKRMWDKGGVVQFENDNIAILKRTWGSQVEFIMEFDRLTLNGFRCVAQDEGSSGTGGGLTGGITSYYYFQNMRRVSCRAVNGGSQGGSQGGGAGNAGSIAEEAESPQ